MWYGVPTKGIRCGVSRETLTSFPRLHNWQTAIYGGPQFAISPNDVSPTNSLVDMTAVDGQTAWVIGTTTITRGATPVPALWKTATGVQGFTTLSTVLPAPFAKIHFFTATTGVAVCDAPARAISWRIFRTINGGISWSAVANTPTVVTAASKVLYAKRSSSNGLWLETSTRSMLHTADAGLTWLETPDLNIVAFEDDLRGLGVQGTGNTQQLFQTADGGATWASVGSSSLPVIESMTAIPGLPGTYMTIGSRRTNSTATATTAITRNRGSNWQVISTDISLFYEVFASSASQIWVLGGGTLNPSLAQSRLLSRFTSTVLGTKPSQDLTLQLTASPNPTSGVFQLNGPLQEPETVAVYDAVGRLCSSGRVSDQQRTVDLAAQAPGLYHVVLTSVTGTVRRLRVSLAL